MVGSSGEVRAAALDGLVVADFSRVLAGPYLTMMLADLGAEVIKVEHPARGDDTRSWGPPFVDGTATYFSAVNRNKRSLAVDLDAPDGQRTARRLAETADVLVENFRPGTMARFGLDYEAVRPANPGLVYCSISGFGEQGGAAMPGYDLLVQAVGGLMSVTGRSPTEPTKAGVALVDVLTGLHGATGVLAALRHRDRTGQGQRLTITLLGSLLSSLVNQASGYLLGGVVPAAMGNGHPSIAPYALFSTADAPLVLAVGNDRQFRLLCTGIDRPELADDDRFQTNPARVAHRDELDAVLTERLRTRPAAAWFEVLTALGVPCGPVNDVAGAFALAESLGLAPISAPDGLPPQVANPIGLSATPATYRTPPPELGGDTDDLRRRLHP